MGDRESSTERQNHLNFSSQKKTEKKLESELNHKIGREKQLEEINANNPSEDTQTELRKFNLKLNELLNKHTKFLIH